MTLERHGTTPGGRGRGHRAGRTDGQGQPGQPPGGPLLQVEQVSFSFGPRARPVLQDVDLTVLPGELVGLLGPNGSGKTTLLRLASGVLAPSAGRISLLGNPLAQLTAAEKARRVAMVRQDNAFAFSYSALEIVLMGRAPWQGGSWWERPEDRRIAQDALQQVDAAALSARAIDTLSGGERQRVLVARALAQQPRLLLLDEATSALDVRHQVTLLGKVRALAQQRGFSVLAALHDLNLASQLCTRIVLLDEGRVQAGGPPDEVLTPELVQQVYGVRVHAGRLPDGHRFLVPLAER